MQHHPCKATLSDKYRKITGIPVVVDCWVAAAIGRIPVPDITRVLKNSEVPSPDLISNIIPCHILPSHADHLFLECHNSFGKVVCGTFNSYWKYWSPFSDGNVWSVGKKLLIIHAQSFIKTDLQVVFDTWKGPPKYSKD